MPPTSTQLAPASTDIPRSMHFALFLTGLVWMLAARIAAVHAAQLLTVRLNLELFDTLLEEFFFVILLLTGFALISWIATRAGGIRATNALPYRDTAPREFRLGLALGWGMLLIAVLPMVIAGQMHPQFWLTPRAWGMALMSLISLVIGTLGLEVAFRGFVFRHLIDAIGPVMATVLISIIYALCFSYHPNSTTFSIFVSFIAGILFSIAYLRTHALWLGWGIHFAWTAVMGVVLGLPVAGLASYSSIVDTSTGGPIWLTGSAYGPESALLTVPVLFAGMIVLYRMTRDYAWEYTHVPIISAGYAMDIAPPKAHTDMEAAATKPAQLVQIMATTSTSSSTLPVIDEHLRTSAEPKDQ